MVENEISDADGDGIADEERQEMSVGLLRSWFLDAVQALVDAMGSEDALRLLRPHFIHSGRAGRRVYHSLVNLDLDGLSSANAAGYAFAPSLGGTFRPSYKGPDGSGIGVMHGCATSGMSREACASLCSYLAYGALKEMNPDWEIALISSLSWGDGVCRWRVWRGGSRPMVEVDEGMRIPPGSVFQDPLDNSTRQYLALAYAGEYWVMATRAILDSSRGGEAIASLLSRARLSGLAVGLRYADLEKEKGKRATALDAIMLISEMHQRKGETAPYSFGTEGTVHECPFAGSAPVEICKQYQAFFNGVCEALSPDSEFSYDMMMTDGDPCCHWRLGPKSLP